MPSVLFHTVRSGESTRSTSCGGNLSLQGITLRDDFHGRLAAAPQPWTLTSLANHWVQAVSAATSR